MRDGLRDKERPGKDKGEHAERRKQPGKEGAESVAKTWFD